MLELAADLRLLDEPADHVGLVAELLAQHLDRQVAAQVGIVPLEDHPHAAAADHAEELQPLGSVRGPARPSTRARARPSSPTRCTGSTCGTRPSDWASVPRTLEDAGPSVTGMPSRPVQLLAATASSARAGPSRQTGQAGPAPGGPRLAAPGTSFRFVHRGAPSTRDRSRRPRRDVPTARPLATDSIAARRSRRPTAGFATILTRRHGLEEKAEPISDFETRTLENRVQHDKWTD